MPHAFFLILELGLGGYADDARQFNKVNKLGLEGYADDARQFNKVNKL